MPNYAYHFAMAEGRLVRRIYRWLLPWLARRPIQPARPLPFEVFSYSGAAALPEQVASIRSFLRHAGRPKSFTIVSDGTHSVGDRKLLEQLDPSVVFQEKVIASAVEGSRGETLKLTPPDPSAPLGMTLGDYLSHHFTGKQLALIMSLPCEGPALYLDSDVLFFPGAADLLVQAQRTDLPALYLADCQFSGDERLLRSATEQQNPVNTGVLFLFRPLDWSLALARFGELTEQPTFFTNQTMAHLAMHANGAAPFDPAKYVLRLDDQTIYTDRAAGSAIALRHYVNPVRHKFWTTLWRS